MAVAPKQRAAQQPRQVLVDLNPAPAKAKVVREGYQVPSPTLDDAKSSFFLDNLKPVPTKSEPRVVSQTIRPGTKVLPGTAVDLILAPTSAVPFDIFDNPHRSLKGKTVDTLLDTLLEDNNVRQTVLKYGAATDVSAADKATLTAKFAQAGMPIDEANADTGFGAAFNSAQGALAFR